MPEGENREAHAPSDDRQAAGQDLIVGYAPLGVISFGLAVGITSAVFVFLLGVVATLFGWGVELAHGLSSVFIGYSPSFVGAIAGAVWAFVDGLIGGVLIAWLYNRFLIRRTQHFHLQRHSR